MSDDRKARLLQKLAKLKALAECPTGNPNEAAAAAASMQRLMLEYQIESAELRGIDDVETISVVTEDLVPGAGYAVYPKWQRILYASMAQANDCMAIRIKPPYARSPKFIPQLLGTPEDVANVQKLWAFVSLEIQRISEEWARDRWWATGKEKNDFLLGAASAVALRVERERRTVVNENPHAMVWLGRKMEAVEAQAPEGLKMTRVGPPKRVDDISFLAGYRAGSDLDFNKPQGVLEAQP